MDIILDVQGFKGPGNQFIVKEIASIVIHHEIEEEVEEFLCTTFKPPYQWKLLPPHYQRLNKWITRYIHGIDWNAGDTSYDKLQQVLDYIVREKEVIYVKGHEKKLWLQSRINKSVIDLENFNCPPLKDRQQFNFYICGNHTDCKLLDIYWCALDNVKVMRKWFKENCCCGEPSLERSLKIYCQLKQSIEDMKAQDLAFFPKAFLITCVAADKIDKIWNKLPESLQNDPEMMKYRQQQPSTDYDDFVL